MANTSKFSSIGNTPSLSPMPSLQAPGVLDSLPTQPVLIAVDNTAVSVTTLYDRFLAMWIRLGFKNFENAKLDWVNLQGAVIERANFNRASLIEADLNGATISGSTLNGANLTRAGLVHATLTGTSLIRANLSGANLSGADLTGADLTGADVNRTTLRGAKFKDTQLSGLRNLQYADLTEAIFSGTLSTIDFKGAGLRWVYFLNADVLKADFSYADLRHTRFTNTYLQAPNFAHADLSNTHFSSTHLQSADLSSANLNEARFRKVIFEHADLSWATFINATFENVRFPGANLEGVDFTGANLKKADFSGAKSLVGVKFNGAFLAHANFARTNLSFMDFTVVNGRNLLGANFSEAMLRGANLAGVLLTGANFKKTNLEGAYLVAAELEEANFFNANLWKTNLTRANLKKANLNLANLSNADLSFADLRGANLQDADLRGADLRGADLRGAKLEGAKNVNFDGSTGRPTSMPEGSSDAGGNKPSASAGDGAMTNAPSPPLLPSVQDGISGDPLRRGDTSQQQSSGQLMLTDGEKPQGGRLNPTKIEPPKAPESASGFRREAPGDQPSQILTTVPATKLPSLFATDGGNSSGGPDAGNPVNDSPNLRLPSVIPNFPTPSTPVLPRTTYVSKTSAAMQKPIDAQFAATRLPTYSTGTAQNVQIPPSAFTLPKIDISPVTQQAQKIFGNLGASANVAVTPITGFFANTVIGGGGQSQPQDPLAASKIDQDARAAYRTGQETRVRQASELTRTRYSLPEAWARYQAWYKEQRKIGVKRDAQARESMEEELNHPGSSANVITHVLDLTAGNVVRELVKK